LDEPQRGHMVSDRRFFVDTFSGYHVQVEV